MATIGRYFYTLTSGANYAPSSNPVQQCRGAVVSGSTTVTVSLQAAGILAAARTAAVARTGSGALQIQGTSATGAYVTVSAVNTGTGAVTISTAATLTESNAILRFWAAGIPNSEQNPITSVYCSAAGTLNFNDRNSVARSIATLSAGTVYDFEISGAVTTATASAFIGIAE